MKFDLRAIVCCSFVALAISVLLMGNTTAQTMEQRQIEFGKDIYKTKATCSFCHRWDGSGDQGYGGLALSLRKTKLNAEQIAEVIRCGRPATAMPYHDQFSYTDDRCYDATKEELGDATPPRAVTTLAPREVQAVVAFIEAKIKGRGPATLQECIDFWGSETKQCDSFR